MQRFCQIETRVLVTCLCALALLCCGSLAGISQAASDDVPQLRQAEQALSKQDPRTAKIHLRNLLKKEPSNASARALLGTIYFAEKNYAGAAKELKIAIRLGAEDPNTLLLLANAYLRQGDKQAIIDQIKIPDGASNSYAAQVMAVRAQALAMSGRVEEGEALLREALELEPESAEALVATARFEFARRELDKALEHSERAANADPEHPQAWLIKGQVLQALRRFPEALKAYERALELSPGWPEALVGRATLRLFFGELEGARQDIEQVLVFAPNAIQAQYLQALLAYQKEDYDSAADTLETIVFKNHEHLQSQLLLGTIRYRQGQLEQARDHLSMFVSRAPKHINARKLLAATYLKLKQPTKAIETLDPIVSGDSDDAQLLALLGSAYVQSGELERGSALLQRAAELAPDAAGIRTQLALTQLVDGNTEDAIVELEAAVELGLSQADFLLVITYLKGQEYDKALAAAEALAAKMPDNPAPYNLIGAALAAKGDKQGAGDAFARALTIAPDATAARFNLAKMQLQAGQREQAIANLDKVLASSPGHLGSATARAGLALQDGNQDQAEALLVAAYEANRDSIRAGEVLSKFYLNLQRPNDALRVARELANKQPDSAQVQRALGQAFVAIGDQHGALQAYRKVIELQPDALEDRYRTGVLQLGVGKLGDAEKNLSQVFESKPDDPRVMTVLAMTQIKLQRYTQAMALAERLQQEVPNSAAGFRLAGDVAAAIGDPKDATEYYRTALAKEPSTGAYKRLYLQQRKDSAPEALKIVREWLAYDPKQVTAALLLAAEAERAQDQDTALAYYQRIIENHPAHATALNNAAWILMKKGDKAAVDLAERAYAAKPDEANIVDTYGMVLLHNGDPEKALILFRKAADRRPKNRDFIYHLALAEHTVGRPKSAIRRLQRLLDTHSDFAERASAEQSLASWKAAAKP